MTGKDGYTRLLTDAEIDNVMVPNGDHMGYKVMGVDPAAGGDNSAIVLKSAQFQQIMFNQQLDNTMDLYAVVTDIYREWHCDMIVIDKTGVGQGLYDRLKNADYPVRGVAFNEKADDEMFQNVKADLH